VKAQEQQEINISISFRTPIDRFGNDVSIA